MDLNFEYGAHQEALMRAEDAIAAEERSDHLADASRIAARIFSYQHKLGAAAACAWSVAQFSDSITKA